MPPSPSSPPSPASPNTPPLATPHTPSPRELEALDLETYLSDPGRKQSFVTPMFEHIAPRYDAFTRLFSFGMDASWKRELMAWFAQRAPARAVVLDVACGTGDLALSKADHPVGGVSPADMSGVWGAGGVGGSGRMTVQPPQRGRAR